MAGGFQRALTVLKCLAWDAVAMAILAFIYKTVVTESAWASVVAAWRPWSDRSLFMVGTFLVHEAAYIGINTVFYNLPKITALDRFKIYRSPVQTPSRDLLSRTLKESLVGHGITQWVGLYILWSLYESKGVSVQDPLPDFWTTFVKLFASLQLLMFGFYWAHRLVHHKSLYASIHKQHHEYTGTIGFAAEFASPVEQILANHIPTAIGPLVMRCHPSLWFVWLAWRLWQTYETHSGYAFPFPFNGFGARYHDFHHSHNLETYSGSPMWDILGGTYGPWEKFIAENPTLDAQRARAEAKGKQ